MYSELGLGSLDFLREEECAERGCSYDPFLHRCDCTVYDDEIYRPSSRSGYDEVVFDTPSRRTPTPTPTSKAGLTGGNLLLIGSAVVAGAYLYGKKK